MGSPVARYELRFTFRAPLDFVYRWCTDYSERDPQLEGMPFRRKIVRRTRRQVIYEDLDEMPSGWVWRRGIVTLRPPNHWTARSIGSHRVWSLDYRLRTLPDGRTELRWRGRRRATEIGGSNPSSAAMRREMRTMWDRYGRALEREYRARPPASRRA